MFSCRWKASVGCRAEAPSKHSCRNIWSRDPQLPLHLQHPLALQCQGKHEQSRAEELQEWMAIRRSDLACMAGSHMAGIPLCHPCLLCILPHSSPPSSLLLIAPFLLLPEPPAQSWKNCLASEGTCMMRIRKATFEMTQPPLACPPPQALQTRTLSTRGKDVSHSCRAQTGRF